MFEAGLVTPKHLSYAQAEWIHQHAVRLVRKCPDQALRMIRASLADLYEQTTPDSISSEIVLLRGSVVQKELEKRESKSNKTKNIMSSIFGDGGAVAGRVLCSLKLPVGFPK